MTATRCKCGNLAAEGETACQWCLNPECEIIVEIVGRPSGEIIGVCLADSRPIYRSRMAGTIYHATEDETDHEYAQRLIRGELANILRGIVTDIDNNVPLTPSAAEFINMAADRLAEDLAVERFTRETDHEYAQRLIREHRGSVVGETETEYLTRVFQETRSETEDK